jgi:methanogenic corrinoid protein MtbC1
LSELDTIIEAISNLDEPTALETSMKMLDNGIDPVEILEKCRTGMSIIGERFQKGEIFLSEMIMAAEIFKGVMNSIKPHLKTSVTANLGKIVIGTVEGDVHDIGKNIVTALLEAEGFEVIDLGVDVPPERFVEALKEYEPDIVGMSGLLTIAIESQKKQLMR